MRKTRHIPMILLALLILFLVNGVLAASSVQYSIDWQSMNAGGAPAESGSGHISMNGSLGQTAIGPSSGSQTTLWAGFWHSIQQALTDLFMPIVMRSQ